MRETGSEKHDGKMKVKKEYRKTKKFLQERE